MVLLQTILIIILVYLGLKLLLKWLAPRLLNYAIKKTSERFGQQFGGHQDFGGGRTQQGDTTTVKKPFRKSNPSKKVGEYIDFEEID
ncbi:protein of unknown function [Flagellimonas taeanensis]|uniref:DUF4834 domain-containing protein n=1 Tax=Flagellimonas taeanensis TaxID=1005926 RepID=A0A1M6VD71_9FLAO|nr:DUF4834 family protein [Allomuricauda taeanensis]MEE1963313.1 DUF4834 family protein [Allomuricauda taeanensis]SFC18521.1 protein of unknown function [Allomuricauda taeanensis]SHK79487.1 protein of unknown function [Allomuricauda taeanensis]